MVFTTDTPGDPREPETPAHLVILSNNGVLLHRVELFGRGSMAAPTIANLEGDGDLELIVYLKDTLAGGLGSVQIGDVSGSAANCLSWPTARGNPLRRGIASTSDFERSTPALV